MSAEDDDIGSPSDDLCDEPLEILTFKHAIVLTGPDGVCLAMTIKAVEESVNRLEEALKVARRSSG